MEPTVGLATVKQQGGSHPPPSVVPVLPGQQVVWVEVSKHTMDWTGLAKDGE